MTTNAAGRPGDALVLTKPLGVGAIVTARKRDRALDDLLHAAIEMMVTLNDRAAEAALHAGVRAMTDVTGFGLLGHLHNLCRESELAAELNAEAVPAIPGVQALLEGEDGVSGGSKRNAEWAQSFATIGPDVQPWRARLLTDATTSGGLLAAVPANMADSVPGSVIGQLCSGPPGTIAVR